METCLPHTRSWGRPSRLQRQIRPIQGACRRHTSEWCECPLPLISGKCPRIRGLHVHVHNYDHSHLMKSPFLQLRYLLVIGRRLSLPKAFGVIFTPGGACLLLYSFRSTICTTSHTTRGSKPTISFGALSSSTYACSIRSSTGYGGRESSSFWSGPKLR